MTIVYAALLFGMLIFPHELGHFIVAKWSGVKVNEFALGMGPAIYKKQKGETQYSLRLIPIGGYCAMEGENEESEDNRSFGSKSSGVRIAILSAGAIMNVIIAVILLTGSLLVTGIPTNTVAEVIDETPAIVMGLEAGDEIIEINNNEITNWESVGSAVQESQESVEVVVLRDGTRHVLTGVPAINEGGSLYIGIAPEMSRNPIKAIQYGIIDTFEMTKLIFSSLGMLISGEVSADQFSGPVGIIQMAGDTAEYGIGYFIFLAAFMSINLAIINLLPLPALDGGRILFVIIRRFAGKAISDKIEGKIHLIGMALLLTFILYITYNDITRLI